MELVIRAICGGILGLLLATYLWVRAGLVEDSRLVVLRYVTVVGASAFFAAKRGDSYWEGVASFFRRS